MFALLTLLASPALALESSAEPDEIEVCASDVSLDVIVDGELSPRCEILFGGLSERDDNRRWRTRRVFGIEDRGSLVDLVHGDASFEVPSVRTLPGMKVVDVRWASVAEESCFEEDPVEAPPSANPAGGASSEAPDASAAQAPAPAEATPAPAYDERVVDLWLGDAWREACGTDRIVLRVDDSVGAGGRVLWIGRRGMLASIGGRLAFIPKTGSGAPAFRMTWRSGFSLDVDDKASKATAKRKPARKKPARRTARRK